MVENNDLFKYRGKASSRRSGVVESGSEGRQVYLLNHKIESCMIGMGDVHMEQE